MKYIARFHHSIYRGIYGGKGDDGFDVHISIEFFDAATDVDAVKEARRCEKERRRLVQVFAIDHQVSLV